MNKQILAVVAVVAGLAAGTAQAEGFFESLLNAIKGEPQQQTAQTPAANVPAAPVVLTPEQIKANRATLEKIFSCQQKAKAADVIKLLESLPGVTKDKPLTFYGGEVDNRRPYYKLQTPLKLWGVNTYTVSVGNDISNIYGAHHAIYKSADYNNFAKKTKFKKEYEEDNEEYLDIKVGGIKVAVAGMSDNEYEGDVFIVYCGYNFR